MRQKLGGRQLSQSISLKFYGIIDVTQYKSQLTVLGHNLTDNIEDVPPKESGFW